MFYSIIDTVRETSERAGTKRRRRRRHIRVIVLRVLTEDHSQILEVVLQQLRQMGEAGLFLSQDLPPHNERLHFSCPHEDIWGTYDYSPAQSVPAHLR